MIAIVPMTEEHIDGVVAVEEATFSIPWTRADFEREVRENNMAIYFVAVEDSKVVGYAGMWHVVVEGHITNVGVLEETRGKGVGSMLMEKLIEVAEEKKMFGITLEVRMGECTCPGPVSQIWLQSGRHPQELLSRYKGRCHHHVEIFF